MGVPAAKKHLKGVFAADFQTPQGWQNILRHIPGGNVGGLLGLNGSWWSRANFQALYVACWIHHPVEKGTFMLALDQPQYYANVKDAYDRLLASGDLQSRPSSHLSGQGASAHEGWRFLRGYEELLLQIEGENTGAPYLLLKCEGHPLEPGFSLSTILHGLSWAVKEVTGAGMTASPQLNQLSKNSSNVEQRAAENFSKSYKKLLKSLKLKGKNVTITDVVETLHQKAGFGHGISAQMKSNTHLLGRAMLGPSGYIALFKRQSGVLKKNGVKFNSEVEKDLTDVANRMVATAVAHPQQHFNEVRVSATELNSSIQAFKGYII
jgi:hypothetical protein